MHKSLHNKMCGVREDWPKTWVGIASSIVAAKMLPFQNEQTNNILPWKMFMIRKINFISKHVSHFRGDLFCFLWTPSFEGNWVSLMGFSLMSGAGVDGNTPYQAQELQITTLANPGIQTNFLPPRPVQS